MKWFWNTECELCGYSTRFFGWQWIAMILAVSHSIRCHPYGYCKISAIDACKKSVIKN